MAFKLRFETLEQRETPAGFEPVDPITGLPIRPPGQSPQPEPQPGTDPRQPSDPGPSVPR